MTRLSNDDLKCEFGDYVCVEQLACDKPATYIYRDEEQVWHFCKEHYGDVADDEQDDE
jgi:hypothetical protein